MKDGVHDDAQSSAAGQVWRGRLKSPGTGTAHGQRNTPLQPHRMQRGHPAHAGGTSPGARLMLDTYREVVTPEGVGLHLPAAGPVPRALAWGIDLAIRIIRQSKNTAEARKNLMDAFELNERQAQAVLDMRLQKLTNMEMEKTKNSVKSLLLFHRTILIFKFRFTQI